MQIGGAETSAEDVAWLETMGEQPDCSRTDLARGFCERRKLVDALGQPRVVAVRIDIARRVREGRLRLPAARPGIVRQRSSPRATETATPLASRPRTCFDLYGLEVYRVHGPTDSLHNEWKRCLRAFHYLGDGPLCGAQIRYVVRSGKTTVAVASFSAAALHVAARDTSIGWNPEAMRRNRHLVVGQSRFCVTVQQKNMASRVQALLLHRLADDWENVYGIRPVLVETFVDTARFSGSSYRAGNWISAGTTSGRGRQDRYLRREVPVKSMWLYPLDVDWQRKLQIKPVAKIDPNLDWAEVEWGGVDLGDRRLTRRLVDYGRARFERPTASVPQTCGSRAATKAAYRLLNHDQATLQRLLSAHTEATVARCAEHRVVLAIQDTTSLNYSGHESTVGLGPIGSHGADAAQGLEVHSVLMAATNGVPLGLLDVNAWARDPKKYGEAASRQRRPMTVKESHKWIRGYRAANDAAERLGGTEVVVVGDREADVFELFEEAIEGRAQLLVRATHPRRVSTPDGENVDKLWDLVRAKPVAGGYSLHVPKRTSRPERTATLDVRYCEVDIAKPRDRNTKHRSVRLWAVAVTEQASSANRHDPIEWLLLTTIPVDSIESAIERVRWYSLRWMIEVFHRTLKSGCRIEDRHALMAETLMAALAVDVVVAWRVMALTKLGREHPDVPCTLFFEDHEWKALDCFHRKSRVPSAQPPTLREAMRMVAQLGGFLGRKCDGDPGTQTIWRGLERLSDIALAYLMFLSSG